MLCLRSAIERLAGFVGGLYQPCFFDGELSTSYSYDIFSRALAIRSNACTILSSRSATFLIGFGSSMSRILTLGTSKNNSPFYVCLAGGNA